MSKLEVGTGIKVLIYFTVWLTITGSSFWAGMTFEQKSQTQSNVEVLAKDSKFNQSITAVTKKQVIKHEKRIETKRPLSRDGMLTDHGLLILQSAVTDARSRVDQGWIDTAITKATN